MGDKETSRGQEITGMMRAMKTILVVDNNLEVLKIIDVAIRSFGFNVRMANGGAEALEIYRSEKIDCVLLDVQMPDMDGPKTLAALKKIDSNVLCWFMSSSAEAVGLPGAAGFLQKPFSLDRLQKILDEMGG